MKTVVSNQAKGRIKKEKVDEDSQLTGTSCLQTLTNCKYRVEGGLLNSKEKDNFRIYFLE
ncbi:MAG: hypothetical protein F6K25_22945 [Okeania sp. SIO2G4]|uniref:hypothetical protein n=1 Tax=unclassified Okeania TaxID=2634635 RepID=UPI0013BE6DD3|nr:MULTISPECIES: hypothetical protein [unclassified Okeania]NEP44912.1 hypothetical protein [Okeania sp. SIO2H7]NEP74640.1 hypothetical protein [Okeania sp. SIO2G5]NEP95895.1 hypothetical protein [Okeania sp. SIO2F5]NEQ93368.1 hypothetical protein [Okeania sp. SIO2G4]